MRISIRCLVKNLITRTRSDIPPVSRKKTIRRFDLSLNLVPRSQPILLINCSVLLTVILMLGSRTLPTIAIKLGWSWLLRSPTEGEPRPIHAHRPAPTAILFHCQRLEKIRRLNGIVWADTLPYIGESGRSGPRRPFSEARSIGVSEAGAGEVVEAVTAHQLGCCKDGEASYTTPTDLTAWLYYRKVVKANICRNRSVQMFSQQRHTQN